MSSQDYLWALEHIEKAYGIPAENASAILNEYGIYSADEALALFRQSALVGGWKKTPITMANGSTMGSELHVTTSVQTAVADSNSAVIKASKMPISSAVESTAGGGTRLALKTGIRETGSFVFGDVIPAIAGAQVGCTLGKAIDSALYNANPNFWDEHGMSTLNPETWGSIVANSDALDKAVFKFLFGIDGDDTQAYMDEDAFVYMAQWLLEQGVFADAGYDTSQSRVDSSQLTYPNSNYDVHVASSATGRIGNRYIFNTTLLNGSGYIVAIRGTTTTLQYGVSLQSGVMIKSQASQGSSASWDKNLSNTASYKGTTFYYSDGCSPAISDSDTFNLPRSTGSPQKNNLDILKIALFGTILNEPIEGIGSQDGATLPDTANWNDAASTKQSLQNQYPDLWNNAKHYDYVDENGDNRTKTFIPVSTISASDKNDTHPTTDGASQANPQADPDISTDTILKLITELITNIPTTTDDNTPTGGGNTPVVPVPTGNASALWSIYNPTQAELDSFGAWLWSSNLVDQLKKLFNDPMQAIIGVHKVFATPPTSGRANIKCGYIDSEISANLVSAQYTTINCGTVSLSEHFGNVFDYSPYTTVSLYLPFIGIVELDIADVMRSSITVKYHVDVITGACLADVIVNRDGAGGVIYQYAGSAIVTYPLSSGSYIGAVTGALTIAGGLATTLLSGGSLAPAVIGAAAGASHLHTKVQKSGGFSGCAGAMGGKKPYLIISRPQTAMAGSFSHFTGLPANSHVTLSNCSGRTKMKSVYIKNITGATEEEKNMIESELKKGILI